MQKQEIVEIIIQELRNYYELMDIESEIDIDTVIFGRDSKLDSLGFVTLLVDIESRMSDVEMEVTLTSEQAMSQRNSPFRSVSTLADFIIGQIR